MSEFEAVPVTVKCEWNNNRFGWWLRIVTLMNAGIHEEILLVNEVLEVERNSVFEGELSFSKEDIQLCNFVPPNLEVYFPQWIALYGKEATEWYMNIFRSLRRLCCYASLLCAFIRSGFDVNFKVRTLSSILYDEIFKRLEGIDDNIPSILLIVDLRELIMFLLRCAKSTGDQRPIMLSLPQV